MEENLPNDDLPNLPKSDYHNIRADWELLKKLVNEIEPHLEAFIGPKKGIRASRRARVRITAIWKLTKVLRKKIIMQRQDNYSDYYDD